MENVREIPAEQTYDIRNEVLRPGLPRTTCVFEGDELATTRHYGYFEKGGLSGVLSIYANSTNLFPEENQMQLRGMAVMKEHRDKKHGVKLLEAAEHYAKSHHFAVIWFNAREVATGFYEKLGYQKKGNAFEIEGVGKHYVMYKYFV